MADDDVVQHPNAEQCTGLPKPIRYFSIFGAWTRITTGVVMDQDQGGCGTADRLAEHFARMHEACGQGTHGNLIGRNQSMSTVEQQHVKRLTSKVSQAHSEMTLNVFRTTDRLAPLERFVAEPARHLNRGA